MTEGNQKKTRRAFLKDTGRIAAGTALAASISPKVYAGENNTLQVALVGCGGRGTGAAMNALETTQVPIELVAMADVFEHRVTSSYDNLYERKASQVKVPADKKFVGLDAYKHAMDQLRPGDVVILGTPPAFRWVHFKYAIDKGLHVFMEKPVTVDAPTSSRMLELSRLADEKNLKVGVGLMVRHCRGRQELYDRIRDGQIGDIVTLRAYRQQGAAGYCFSEPTPAGKNEYLHQIERFHSFLWASGGLFSDFYIHQIDECCWMKDSWPVQAQGIGGRHYRENYVDQNFDSYGVEYTFEDGAKLFLTGQTMENTHLQMDSYAHGTKGMAIISSNGHAPGKVRIFDAQTSKMRRPVWAFPQPEPNPYQLEWDDLVAAIVNDEPFNEVPRGVRASLVTSMGRMAAHTGRVVTWDEMQEHNHEFAPGLDQLTEDSPAPLAVADDGSYPLPEPGVKLDREY